MISTSDNKRSLYNLLFSATIFGMAFAGWWAGFFSSWELRTSDYAVRYFAKASSRSQEIVLVALDQKSLAWVHENLSITWPWPRELHGAVLSPLSEFGTKAVGVDVLFTEPSAFGVSDDQKLASSLQSNPTALGSVSFGKSGNQASWPTSFPTSNLKYIQHSEPGSFLPEASYGLLPIDVLAQSAKLLCNVAQRPDDDGAYRRLQPFTLFDNRLVAALGIGIFLADQPNELISFQRAEIAIGENLRIPLDKSGRAMLKFYGPSGTVFPTISAGALIDYHLAVGTDKIKKGEELKKIIASRYVIYGFTAPGLRDLRPSPVGSTMPGIELHATMLNNVLEEDFLKAVSPLTQWTAMGLILILLSVLLGKVTSFWQQAGVILAALLFPPALYILLYLNGFIAELVVAESVIIAMVSCMVLINYYTVGRERRFIKHSFRHYLSPAVVEELIKDPSRLALGGERRELTILFSDLEDFTRISEQVSPEDLARLLNEFLTEMTDIILEENGTIDKYEGDAIIAFWNAPLPVEHHQQKAVNSALRCQQRLAQMRSGLRRQYGCELHMRIGINSGPAVIGNFGSSRRFDYTMLGDAVNLAARLEGINKLFGTYTMISEFTNIHLDETMHSRRLGAVQVIGRDEPVMVYEPLEKDRWLDHRDRFERFEQGLQAFENGAYQQALEFFGPLSPEDQPAKRYSEVCLTLCAGQTVAYMADTIWLQQSK
ncbi:MAG: adenylate/guanylate cyclase domain-containing protein [Desulfobulbaceae bacterium]|nr:MAG: adenylate/guanylate cyclase domain-containing protein [Desulfobulbaceae bacterium]